MFPGEVHKPTITMAALDNYIWGEVEPEPPVVVQEREVPVYIKSDPIVIEKTVVTPAPPPVVVEKKVPVEVPVP